MTNHKIKTDVSVIIPIYNRQKTLARAIDSILQQTWPVKEIILIDDGSTDSSSDIARYYAQHNSCIKFISQTNAGAAAARNQGLALATGAWISFLDSDDQWLPNKNQACLRLYTEHPTIEFIHTFYIGIKNGQKNLRLNNDANIRQSKKHLLSMFGIKTSTVMFCRVLLEKTGFFNIHLKTCEDYELFWRLVACSKEIGYLVDDLVIVEESPNSLMATVPLAHRKKDDITALSSALKWIKEQGGYENDWVDAMSTHRYWMFVDLLSFNIQERKLFELVNNYRWFIQEQDFLKATRAIFSAIRNSAIKNKALHTIGY